MKDHCPNFDFIVFRKLPVGQIQLTRLRCKSWSCDFCAKKNREMWRAHLKKKIAQIGGDWWFLTITAAAWAQSAAKSLKTLRRGIDLLLKRIRRIWGKVEYVRVYERHKTGVFHAHMVISGLSNRVKYRLSRAGQRVFTPSIQRGAGVYSLRTWFKKTAGALHMGYMVDVQRLETVTGAVNYVCKYMTKGAQRFSEKGLRRIQCSQGIGAANARGSGGWTAAKYMYASDAAGLPVYDLNKGITIQPEWWLKNFTYPSSAQA